MGRYLVYSDYTDSAVKTPSNSTLPQVLKSTTLNASDAFNIVVSAVLRITSLGTSTAQAVNPTIIIGSNTRTFAFNSKAAVDDDYLSITFAAESRAAGDIAGVQLNASAASDANTSVTCKSFAVEQISP